MLAEIISCSTVPDKDRRTGQGFLSSPFHQSSDTGSSILSITVTPSSSLLWLILLDVHLIIRTLKHEQWTHCANAMYTQIIVLTSPTVTEPLFLCVLQSYVYPQTKAYGYRCWGTVADFRLIDWTQRYDETLDYSNCSSENNVTIVEGPPSFI